MKLNNLIKSVLVIFVAGIGYFATETIASLIYWRGLYANFHTLDFSFPWNIFANWYTIDFAYPWNILVAALFGVISYYLLFRPKFTLLYCMQLASVLLLSTSIFYTLSVFIGPSDREITIQASQWLKSNLPAGIIQLFTGLVLAMAAIQLSKVYPDVTAKRAHILLLICSALLLTASLIFIEVQSKIADNMPGTTVGINPWHIPESKLPLCDAPAGGIVNKPCYSPPGALYL